MPPGSGSTGGRAVPGARARNIDRALWIVDCDGKLRTVDGDAAVNDGGGGPGGGRGGSAEPKRVLASRNNASLPVDQLTFELRQCIANGMSAKWATQ